MAKKIQFTNDGFIKLQEELKELNEVKRPKAVERLSKARAMGDLSENSEYTAAKEDLEFVTGRIRELEEAIKNAEIVENGTSENTVSIGCKVTVELNGKQDVYFLVGEFEANPMEKKLSQTSPIGKALMGRKVGDSVSVDVPAGTIKFKILDVQPA
jgi:transcription elongation factor GreA